MKIWNHQDDQVDWTSLPTEGPLEKPNVDDIRKAAAQFKTDTALSGDFIHPKSVTLLDDLALDILGDIFLLLEEAGKLGRSVLTIVFLSKPDGGKRPIGLLPGLLRLWGKVRRGLAKQWEKEHQRPYFWGEARKPAAGSVHLQSLRNEVAKAKGEETASTLLDM
eukprot:1449737-Karenia_brevis.AAC.1